MIDVTDVKDYLRIPYDEDDAYIQAEITSGYDYLEDAITNYEQLYESNEKFARKADSWVLRFWMPDAYDQREGGHDGLRAAMNYPARALLTQLQNYEVET